MAVSISDFDQFFMEIAMFPQWPFICASTDDAIISLLTSAEMKFVQTVYRMKIGGIEFELWPFLQFFRPLVLYEMCRS